MSSFEFHSLPTIHVTKFDAMRRQLTAAVRLWFDDGDPIAIHTLLFASHEILHTFFRRRGHNNLLFDNRNVIPAYRKEWAKKLTEAGTFFKHARADPDASMDFNPHLNEMFLLFSIYALREMKETLAPEERAFTHWIFVNRPEILIEWAYDGVPVENIEELRGVSRKQFLEQALSAYRQLGIK